MSEWHGDEDEVEFTAEELYELASQEADLQNDEDWLDSYQNISNILSNYNRVRRDSIDCPDARVYINVGVEHE